ncbi:hypothetical protein VTK73DRAFT_946 [Phialemonium thermophilum]|uniref:Uncharacterized protein n=1 Tax=Phialemonium thermophilum TaxID=223376 RepID=A0ABR3XCU9_9PEZI
MLDYEMAVLEPSPCVLSPSPNSNRETKATISIIAMTGWREGRNCMKVVMPRTHYTLRAPRSFSSHSVSATPIMGCLDTPSVTDCEEVYSHYRMGLCCSNAKIACRERVAETKSPSTLARRRTMCSGGFGISGKLGPSANLRSLDLLLARSSPVSPPLCSLSLASHQYRRN